MNSIWTTVCVCLMFQKCLWNEWLNEREIVQFQFGLHLVAVFFNVFRRKGILFKVLDQTSQNFWFMANGDDDPHCQQYVNYKIWISILYTLCTVHTVYKFRMPLKNMHNNCFNDKYLYPETIDWMVILKTICNLYSYQWLGSKTAEADKIIKHVFGCRCKDERWNKQ